VKKRPRPSEARLAVLGKMIRFLASQMQPANFLFGSFLFFSGKREMNSPRPEGVQSDQSFAHKEKNEEKVCNSKLFPLFL
jgi:hypothetical protein